MFSEIFIVYHIIFLELRGMLLHFSLNAPKSNIYTFTYDWIKKGYMRKALPSLFAKMFIYVHLYTLNLLG